MIFANKMFLILHSSKTYGALMWIVEYPLPSSILIQLSSRRKYEGKIHLGKIHLGKNV